jgi:protein-disulfide isomerase
VRALATALALATGVVISACSSTGATVPAPTGTSAPPQPTAAAKPAAPASATAPAAVVPVPPAAASAVASTGVTTGAGRTYPGPFFLGRPDAPVTIDEYADFQ